MIWKHAGVMVGIRRELYKKLPKTYAAERRALEYVVQRRQATFLAGLITDAFLTMNRVDSPSLPTNPSSLQQRQNSLRKLQEVQIMVRALEEHVWAVDEKGYEARDAINFEEVMLL